jgi:hypothetical protein
MDLVDNEEPKDKEEEEDEDSDKEWSWGVALLFPFWCLDAKGGEIFL